MMRGAGCVEAAIDFTTAEVGMIAFTVGAERFLPVEVMLEGEPIGTVSEIFSRESFNDWLQSGPSDPISDRRWLLQLVREGRAAWVTRSPGSYDGDLVFPDGTIYELPPLRFDVGWTGVGMVWKDEFDPPGP